MSAIPSPSSAPFAPPEPSAPSGAHTARAPSGLSLNPSPQRKFWFDPPTPRANLAAERRHRQERLAATFRLFARQGFDKGLAGHVTARDPELTDHFWVNPLGLHFSRIRVSDLLLVNSQGEIALGDAPLNQAAFAIHAAIHRTHPRIVAAAHTHSVYGKAWSTLGRALDPLSQDACAFYDDHVLFDDFTGVVLETSEGERIARALGRPDGSVRKGAILRNHGIISAGPSVEAAAWWYLALDDAAHTQLLAEAAGAPKPIDAATARLAHTQVGSPESALFAFESLYAGLVAAEPDLLD